MSGKIIGSGKLSYKLILLNEKRKRKKKRTVLERVAIVRVILQPNV